jgi:hypothetical protein
VPFYAETANPDDNTSRLNPVLSNVSIVNDEVAVEVVGFLMFNRLNRTPAPSVT